MDFIKIKSELEALQAELEEIKRISAENERLYAEIRKRLEDKKYDNL